jgi:hypothetical protein
MCLIYGTQVDLQTTFALVHKYDLPANETSLALDCHM